jgi:murein tripeptide amidase MpaA
MPGYLTVAGLDAAVQHLVATYPDLCHPVILPEPSVEGRPIHALRLGARRAPGPRGVFFLAGVHAREVVNPDLLVSFALQLCRAHAARRPLTLGRTTVPAAEVQALIHDLDLYLLPLANPDGRAWVQAPGGDPMWRKNRRPAPASSHCAGVDLNRNYDFLWATRLGASARPCQETFSGPAAFSEPETRNVRHVLDAHPAIRLFVDLHSFSESVFYPWGDDDDQSEDPSMSFENPAYDGARGKPHDGGYREFIPPEDRAWFLATAGAVREAVAAARGTRYAVTQSVGLYPTSGCGDDYTYARARLGQAGKVMAFTVETGREFQPPYAEAAHIITEVSAGLVAYCRAALALAGSP